MRRETIGIKLRAFEIHIATLAARRNDAASEVFKLHYRTIEEIQLIAHIERKCYVCRIISSLDIEFNAIKCKTGIAFQLKHSCAVAKLCSDGMVADNSNINIF